MVTPNPATSAGPSTSTPSSLGGGMTLEAIMAQLQRMHARRDTLTIELYQVNTHVGHIAQRQVRLGGFVASPTPSLSPKASDDEDSNGSVDGDEDASSSNNAKITTSQ